MFADSKNKGSQENPILSGLAQTIVRRKPQIAVIIDFTIAMILPALYPTFPEQAFKHFNKNLSPQIYKVNANDSYLKFKRPASAQFIKVIAVQSDNNNRACIYRCANWSTNVC